MKNSVDKKKIIKYTATGLLTTYIATSGIINLIETNIDHLHEYCPLNKILGIEHQIDEINEQYGLAGLNAHYEDEINIQETVKPTTIQNEDGQIIYTIPDGYILEGEVGIKNIHKPERIVIKQKSKELYYISIPSKSK